jgi:GNAT superfamily N-acetyltransferase
VAPQRTDTSLVSQIHEVQFEYLRGRMEVMRSVRGDSWSTRYLELGHLRACMAPGVPNPFFNQVFISGPANQQHLESVLAEFEESGMTPRFEIGPGAPSRELAMHLAGRGFMHTQSDPMLIQTSPAGHHGSGPEIRVERVQSVEALAIFRTTYVRAWQVEAWLAPMLRSYVERWLDVPGWTLYLAKEGDLPVGVGVLFSKGDVAYLADAATIPEYRGRGAQSALISQRIVDAWRTSLRLVFSRADFGSSSHRNLERAGLESRYTVSIWTKET